MSFVDRGGGGESRGGSLRRLNKSPLASATQQLYIGAAVAIPTRTLEAERDGLMGGVSQEAGVAAVLTWCTDFERQEALLDFCRQHNTTTTATSPEKGCSAGNMYCVVGVHVDNMNHMHMKEQQSWLERVATWGKQSVVLGILSGLNLEYDSGTHIAQEWLLEQLWYTAGALQVPLVLHVSHGTSGDDGGGGINGISFGEAVPYSLTDSNPTVDRAAALLADLMSRKDDCDDEKDGDGGNQRTTKKKPTGIVLINGVNAIACSSAMRALLKRCVPLQDSTGATTEVMENAESLLPMYVIATAEGITDGENNRHSTDKEFADIPTWGSSFPTVLRNHIVPSQLLIGTGIPWNTPQNISDVYLFTMTNEPAHYRNVATVIHEVPTSELLDHPLGKQSLYSTVRDNFLRAFFSTDTSKNQLQEEAEEAQEKKKEEEQQQGEAEDLTISEVVPSVPLPMVHVDPQITPTFNTMHVSDDSTRYFLCFKCRRRLFDGASLLTHPQDATRVKFGGGHNRKAAGGNANPKHNNSDRNRVGEACGNVWFVSLSEGVDGGWSLVGGGLVVERQSGVVQCGGCHAKIGFAGELVCCPCGRTVAGLSARVAASKVEASVTCVDVCTLNVTGTGGVTSAGVGVTMGSGGGGGDLNELLAQAARERQQLQEEEDGGRDGMESKKKKGPKKNVKANNRSNFTHFRNKNFVPRHQKSNETLDDSHSNDVNDSDGREYDDDYKQSLQFIAKQHPGRRRKK